MSSLLGACAGSKRGRESGNHGIAGAGNIRNLVRTKDRNVHRFVFAGEGSHAIAPSSDYKRLQLHARHYLFASDTQSRPIVSDPHTQCRFNFRFIGRGRNYSRILQHPVARVEYDRTAIQTPSFADRVKNRRARRAITIIRDEQRIRSARILSRRQHEFAFQVTVGFLFGFTIDTHNLLPRSMRHARQNAGFSDGGVTFIFQNAAYRDVFMTKTFQEQAASLIVAHHSHRQNIDAQVRKIIDRVGPSARHEAALPMLQDQHRRFSRDARDFPKNEFVGHQVADHGDGDLGKGLNNLFQPLLFFGMFRHLDAELRSASAPIFSRLALRSEIIRSMVSTALAASTSSILTGMTVRGWSACRYPPRLIASFSVVTKLSASLCCRSFNRSSISRFVYAWWSRKKACATGS